MRLLLALALVAVHLNAWSQTVRLEGEDVAVFNLAGSIRVEIGGGGAAEAVVELRGPDADRLQIETVSTSMRGERTQALVIRYPDRDVVYREMRGGGSTQVRVSDDGTFHRSRGEKVRIRGSGNGLEAHADIVVRVPPGFNLNAYQAVGEIIVDGVDADLYLDTHSGDIEVTNVNGDIAADTGSGRIRIAAVTGERVSADTGSGAVSLSDLNAEVVLADTGSGAIELRGVNAARVVADAGSGSIEVEHAGGGGEMNLDTGSGRVRVAVPPGLGLEVRASTGSGGVRSQLADMNVREADPRKLIAYRGDRDLRLTIDTGSGSVTLTE